MTPEQQASCFKLLDSFVRTKHNCFVSEFFFVAESGAYTVCFRPVGVSPEDANRSACKYLQLAAADVERVASESSVPLNVTAALDAGLAMLAHD